jgi:beta-lactam-binding protein with PASTA domain
MPWRRRRRQVTEETAPQPAARYVEEEVAAPPPRRPLIWPWLLLLLLLVGGAIAAAILLTRDDGSTTRVPNVVGLGTAAAVQQLGQRGYATDVRSRVSNGEQVGRVLSQAPAGGTKLDRGSRVTIVTARGPVSTGVPGVVGLPVAEAFVRLQAAGLKGTTTKVASNRLKDTVLRQSPAAGAQAKKGATVLLTISKGGRTVTVPRVVGLTEALATAKLDGLGFRTSVSRVVSTKPAGLVVSQEPAQGAKAAKGSVVGINVSQGPPTTTETTTTTTTTPRSGGSAVPRVVGMSQREAFSRLEQSGFRVDSYPVASSRPRGLVVSQRPAGSARAPARTVVRISVALGSGARPLRVVPDVTGQNEADAKRVLVQVGFTVRALEAATDTTSRSDVVVDQKPSAGARVRAGSQVLIYLGPAQ